MRWLLHDPAAQLDDYVFAINPNAMDSPYLEREVVLHRTIDGQFRGLGSQAPHSWTFSGVLYEQPQYAALDAWSRLGTRIQLTDHLGRTWLVRLTRFEPTRAGRRDKPWRHTYTVSVTTYGGPL